MSRKKTLQLLIMLLITALVLVGCGGGDDNTGSGEVDMSSFVGGDALLEMANNGDFDGTTVTMFGAMVDEDANSFDSAIADFEERSGIDIQYEGSADFETLIQVRVDGGDPPDIGSHPQPGLL